MSNQDPLNPNFGGYSLTGGYSPVPPQQPITTFNIPGFAPRQNFWDEQRRLTAMGYANPNFSPMPGTELNYSPVPTRTDYLFSQFNDPNDITARLGAVKPIDISKVPPAGKLIDATDGNWWDSYVGEGKLFTSGGDALKGVGSVAQGIGSLMGAWTAMKGLDLAKQAAATQEAQWQKNYDATVATTNNAIANQNAWKAASGRTDFGQMIGGASWKDTANLAPAQTA